MRATRTRLLWRQRDRDHADDVESASSDAIGAECEALVDGRYVEHLVATGAAVPMWALINEVAHGDFATVRERARAEAEHARSADAVRGVLARAVLAALGAKGDLAEVQRRVLVPIELSLVGQVVTPRRLIELVGKGLFDVTESIPERVIPEKWWGLGGGPGHRRPPRHAATTEGA